MNETYTVCIEDSVKKSEREVSVPGDNPMIIHKDVFMKTSRYEEINTIHDSSGKIVFDRKNGFYGRH